MSQEATLGRVVTLSSLHVISATTVLPTKRSVVKRKLGTMAEKICSTETLNWAGAGAFVRSREGRKSEVRVSAVPTCRLYSCFFYSMFESESEIQV